MNNQVGQETVCTGIFSLIVVLAQPLPNIKWPTPVEWDLYCCNIVHIADWNVAGLFARALEGVNVKELITNIGSAAGSAPAGGDAPASAAVSEEKKGTKHNICSPCFCSIQVFLIVHMLQGLNTESGGQLLTQNVA